MFTRNKFNQSDLDSIDLKHYCIMSCGGPLLKILLIDGDNILVEYNEDDKIVRKVFKSVMLRRLVPFYPTDKV